MSNKAADESDAAIRTWRAGFLCPARIESPLNSDNAKRDNATKELLSIQKES